ncbi:hypothetical protein [Palleronia sp. LCG004]|uniref:hypothetical protein n=1 Tax=Palleronia sp. LCG004 TaxID=3079304 RepID=UPI002943AFE9|nr:hypothetical protein [Palleronia sp. LCG004]WOI56868.1 hypothetical protein RVY76_03475 [Palleronia sp. LCG004]
MVRNLVCGAMLAATAATADAAVYRYDMTMELVGLRVNGTSSREDFAPDLSVPGLNCHGQEYDAGTVGAYVEHRCNGDAVFTTLDGVEGLEDFTDILTGSFYFDLDPVPSNAKRVTQRFCEGSPFFCRSVSYSFDNFHADETGFRFQSSHAGSAGFMVDNFGLSYLDDSVNSFTYGNTSYFSYDGVDATYRTTAFNVIAPVPLPTGAALLATGLFALGWRRGRRNRDAG